MSHLTTNLIPRELLNKNPNEVSRGERNGQRALPYRTVSLIPEARGTAAA